MMLTGVGHDTMVNSILFIAGVFPSHLHCWYLSLTYFHRRRKARKGKYPGDHKALIASKNVLNGGLSSVECERRWWAENGGKIEKRRSRKSGTSNGGKSKRQSRQSSWRDAETQVYPVQQNVDMRFSQPPVPNHRIHSWRSDIPVGHDVELSPALPPRPGLG
jgi:hypothetical protein